MALHEHEHKAVKCMPLHEHEHSVVNDCSFF